MKHKNIAKRVLACGLAVAMVVTSGNYSSVNVSAAKKTKKAAKKTKAKLSKKKASITAGGTLTLKVKKAGKKVKWSIKNKKVAKIKSTSGKKKDRATIQGLKKGSTVVVAKVGKVKLKCKLKVKANAIKSVSVDKLDYSALTVKFAKKTSLNASAVKVAIKAYKSGSYNLNPKVEALSTKDQKTYRLYLTSAAGLNDYVRVTIGKNSKEIQNKQAFGVEKDTITYLLEKDVVVKGNLDYCFYQPVGFISYSLKKGSKLPKGLSLVGKRGLLKGIPTEAGTTETTLIGQDEAGRKATLKVVFKVYDESTIAVSDSTDNKIKLDDYMTALNASRLATATPAPTPTATPEYTMDPDYPGVNTPAPATKTPDATVNPEVTPDANTVYTSYKIGPKGGSGSYKYDLVQTGTDAGVKLSTDVTDSNNQVTKKAAGSTELYIPYGLAAGDHTYSITITDAADATRTTTATVVVKVIDNFNVSGTVKDMADNPVSGNESLYFYPADAKNGSEYVYGRDFKMYAFKSANDEYRSLMAGNHPDGYIADENYSVDCANGDRYEVYERGETTKVGPFPVPTILKEAPTATPAVDPAAATAAPSTTPFVIQPIEAGTYAAEVPAGTYTVKLMGNNGVKYEMNDKVTVAGDAVAALNLTMPVRFANIKGIAKFANDKAVMNDEIYFETENKQYEGWKLCADTDYQGSFSASLPAGTYKMYWVDEQGQRQYFANSIKVEDGTNAEIGEQKLAVSRYEVSGIFKIHQKDYYTDAEVDELAPYESLYFYDAKGNVVSTRTKYDSHYDKAQGKFVDGAKHGSFDKVLLDNGTYTVRYYDGSNYGRGLSTIGTITVNGADVQQNFVYNKLDAGITAEYANAAVLTLEQDTVYASTGNNDLLVRFTIPETPDKAYTSYDITARFNDSTSRFKKITIYKESGDAQKTYEEENTLYSVENTLSLAAGTYIMNVTPATPSRQRIGNVNVKVSKHLQGYEKSSTAVTLDGTPVSVVCAKNVQDTDLRYCAYVKVPVVEGQTYEINYAAKTIGVKNLSVTPVSYSLLSDYKHYTNSFVYNDDDDYYYDDDVNIDSSYADGSGKITFRADGSGDVYLEFRTDSTLYTTIDVSAVAK